METRLRIAKLEYKKGNLAHPYVKEFISKLEATKPAQEEKPVRKNHKKYWKKIQS